jgi:hypothetical protein
LSFKGAKVGSIVVTFLAAIFNTNGDSSAAINSINNLATNSTTLFGFQVLNAEIVTSTFKLP